MKPHSSDRELLKSLINAAGYLWRLEKHRSSYEKLGAVFGKEGCRLNFDEAMEQAMANVEKALQEAGQIYLPVDRN